MSDKKQKINHCFVTLQRVERRLNSWATSIGPQRAALLQIVIALVFASAILLIPSFLKDSEHLQSVTYLLIAAWWIPFSLLAVSSRADEGVSGEFGD